MRRLMTAMLVLLVPALAAAQVPATMGYQGRLIRADGTPESGVLTITFALFDAETGGQARWSEELEVAVSDGFYSVVLGEQSALAEAFANGGERYLELSIAGTAFSPRQKVASVPYAIQCDTARNVVGGTVDAESLTVGGAPLTGADGKLEWENLSGCPVGGTVLHWNGDAWTCREPASGAVSVAAPLVGDGLTTPIGLPAASGSSDGYLSSSDWNAFDAKVSSVEAATGGGLLRTGSEAAPELGLTNTCSDGAVLRWNGASWECSAAPDGDAGGYIQNQAAADQAASFRLSEGGSLRGNLGVGTATPDARLQVIGSDERTGTGTISAAANSVTLTGAGTLFKGEVSPGDLILVVGQTSETRRVASVSSDTTLRIDRSWGVPPTASTYSILKPIAKLASAANAAPAMIVNQEGYVGIGTPTPQGKLHVEGGLVVGGGTQMKAIEAREYLARGSIGAVNFERQFATAPVVIASDSVCRIVVKNVTATSFVFVAQGEDCLGSDHRVSYLAIER